MDADTLSDQFPEDPLPPGTHLLGVSPPMLGLHGLVSRYLAQRLETGDGCVVVTTDRDARSVVDAIAGDAADVDRLGIVDATGQEPADEAMACRLESVTSPADLTGVGIGVSKLLEALHGSGAEDFHVVVDSVSSLLVYTGFERVYRFLHTVTNLVDTIDGTSVSLLSGDTDQMEVGKLESLVDGVVEVRETDFGPAYRVRGHEGASDWRSFEAAGRAWVATTDSAPGKPREGVDDTPERPLEPPDSLRSVIETMDATELTLTLCNYSEDNRKLEELRDHFERFNVSVRTATLSTETPANVALLHRGPDVLAMDAASQLHVAVSPETLEAADDLSTVTRPNALDHVHRHEYAVEDGTKLDLIRVSRLIEMRTLGTGSGTLHAGFQRLDRIDDEFDTRELYERIAQTDAAIHLYGQPGTVPNADQYTLHTVETGELADCWFVVYDGGGRDARKGALLCEQTEPGRYTGFWTYQPAVVDAIAAYLERTYRAT